jgi:hypothetical protein
MNFQRLLQVLACGSVAIGLSACGMFDSKPPREAVATGPQEFDPYANTWRTTQRVVTPPPSEPNRALAAQAAAEKEENSALNKAGRAMNNTASAVTRAVKKPLEWWPFGKKDEQAVD